MARTRQNTTALEDADAVISRLEGLSGIMDMLALTTTERDQAMGESDPQAVFFAFMARQLELAKGEVMALYTKMKGEGRGSRLEYGTSA